MDRTSPDVLSHRGLHGGEWRGGVILFVREREGGGRKGKRGRVMWKGFLFLPYYVEKSSN